MWKYCNSKFWLDVAHVYRFVFCMLGDQPHISFCSLRVKDLGSWTRDWMRRPSNYFKSKKRWKIHHGNQRLAFSYFEHVEPGTQRIEIGTTHISFKYIVIKLGFWNFDVLNFLQFGNVHRNSLLFGPSWGSCCTSLLRNLFDIKPLHAACKGQIGAGSSQSINHRILDRICVRFAEGKKKCRVRSSQIL